MKHKTVKAADTADSSPWTSDLRPARGDLRIVQAFVNTRDPKTAADELGSPQTLADWLAKWRLFPPGTRLEPSDLERALTVRESLRSLLGTHSGAPLDAAAVARLDRIAAETPCACASTPTAAPATSRRPAASPAPSACSSRSSPRPAATTPGPGSRSAPTATAARSTTTSRRTASAVGA